ncbi:MAG: hypothetical protein ACHREM_05300 [Polyangiales bacterium]
MRLPITCPKYAPTPGSRRCEHFEPNGACRLPGEFMCVEWVKANGEHAPAASPARPGLAGEEPTSASSVTTTALTVAPMAPAAAPQPPAPTPPPVAATPASAPPMGRTAALATERPAFALTTPPAPAVRPPPPAALTTQRPPTSATTTRAHAPSDADVAAFKDRDLEVLVATDTLGEIAIVPAYTSADRLELTIAHAALIASVCAAFPGAHVTAIRRATKSG